MSIYEYTKSNKPFETLLNNKTVIKVNRNDSLVKLIDKVSITQKSNKYKILLINCEKDLIKFNNIYGVNHVKNNRELKWNLVSEKYGGIIIDSTGWSKIYETYYHNYSKFGWIDSDWWSDYGYIWRFKLK